MDQPSQFASLPPLPHNRSIDNRQFSTISTPRYQNKRNLSFKKSDRLNIDSPLLRKLNQSVEVKKYTQSTTKNTPEHSQPKQGSSPSKIREKSSKTSERNLVKLPSVQKRKNTQTIQLRRHIKGKRENYGQFIDLDIDRDISGYKKQLFTRLDPKIYQLAIRTKAGRQGNLLKINQDIQIINQKLPFGIKLFCVCDGHGAYGHFVVAFIKKKFIENLNFRLKQVQNMQIFQEEIYLAFQKTNNDLLLSEINTELSGATVVAIFVHHERLLCFNVGDSRAIFINYEYGFLKTKPISNDHKPSRSDEARRVIAAGGRIQHHTNQKNQIVGPLRVWLKDIKSPGLAMTRSFGDKVGGRCGVIAEPEITDFKITNEQKYLLIGSDGLWEQIESHEVIKYVQQQLRQDLIEQAADKLLNKAVQLWDEKYNTRDDITFILIKLNSLKKEVEQLEK